MGTSEDKGYNYFFCYIPSLDPELCSADVSMSEW